MKQYQDLREKIKDNRKMRDAFLSAIFHHIGHAISHVGRGLAGVVHHVFNGGKNIFENDFNLLRLISTGWFSRSYFFVL